MPHGSNDNVNVWAGADVLIGSLDAPIPALGLEFDMTKWEFVGTLDGKQGFEGKRDSDSNDIFGWGRGIVAQTDKHYKETKTFTSMEASNEVILKIAYPGSEFTFSDVASSGELKVPSKEPFKIAFITYRGDIEQRYISRNYATLDEWPVASQNEEDPESMECTAVVYPDTQDRLWHWQKFDRTAVFKDWAAQAPFNVGDVIRLAGDKVLRVTVAGTSGQNAPTAPGAGKTVTDGSITWTQVA